MNHHSESSAAESIVTGVRRTFRFSGKTTRRDYWRLACAIGLLLTFMLTCLPEIFGVPLSIFAGTTLSSATVRRLRDAGAPVVFAWTPFVIGASFVVWHVLFLLTKALSIDAGFVMHGMAYLFLTMLHLFIVAVVSAVIAFPLAALPSDFWRGERQGGRRKGLAFRPF